MKLFKSAALLFLGAMAFSSCKKDEEESEPVDLSALSGLITYYSFDNNINNSTSDTLNGSASSTTYTTDRNGNASSALALDGTMNTEITTGQTPIEAGSFSITFWLKVKESDYGSGSYSSGGYRFLSSRESCTVGKFFDFQYNPVDSKDSAIKRLSVETRVGSDGAFSVGSGGFPYDTWVNVIATFNNDSKISRMYFDGVIVDEASWDGKDIDMTNTADLLIGGSPCIGSNGAEYFKGEIDDLAIVDRVLTTQEILNIAEE